MSEQTRGATHAHARKRRGARIATMAGWPIAYVLAKIGSELRPQYMRLVNEPLPDGLKRLAERLRQGKAPV